MTDHRPTWADDRSCSDCCGAFVCGMPTDDGGTWCEREQDIAASCAQVRHHLGILVSLGALSAEQADDTVSSLSIGGA